jgi:uncharacterized protein YcfJ
MMKTNITQFNNKYIAMSIATLCVSLASPQSLANSYTDYAKVTNVSPIYETITIREPHKQCHLEERTVRHSNPRSATPTILGALIGGAIGNGLGHNKSNKRVGAVAGAILGGSIASDLNRNNQHHKRHQTKTERICSTSYSTRHEKQVSGYNVDYKYRGHIYNTIMDTHPGDRIQVAVDVSPIAY